MDIDLELVFDVEIHCTRFINPATTRNPYNGLLGFVSVAGMLPVANSSRSGLMSMDLAALFSIKNAHANNGSVTLNIGRKRGPIWAHSLSLGGHRTVCFIARDAGIEFLGSSLENSVLRDNITATLVDGQVQITAITESGSGFVNVYAFYIGE